MKVNLYIPALIFGIAQMVSAQTQQQQITDINKAIQQINNNIGNLYFTEDFKDSAGCLNVFADNKELKLESVYMNNNNMDKFVEWYFLNGQMIYASQLWIDKATNKPVVNYKSYFSSGHLMYLLENENQVIDSTSKTFKEVDKIVVAYGAKLEDAYARKKKENLH